jgi:Tfp pilus assembly protein PilF
MPIRDTQRWQKLKHIFELAMDLPPAEADAVVKQECGGDDELLTEVRDLLENHRRQSLLVDHAAAGVPALSGLLPHRALQSGAILADRFRVVDFLGEGGIGEVYSAEDLSLHIQVAIKTLHPARALEPSTLDRFRREIQLARRISHPAVCRVHDFYAGNPAFLSMEFLEGHTLAEHIRQSGPLSTAAAAPIVEQLCHGLAAAHAQNVIHRDLKPSNIMICGPRAVILDFGLALLDERRDDTGATLPSSTLGTPAYMSPEQLEGRRVTAASDVYSLGMVVFEILTATQPLAGLSPLAIAARRVQEQPPSPRAIVPQTPASWDAAVRKALAVNPEERFPSALEFWRAVSGESRLWNLRFDRRALAGGAAAVAATSGFAFWVTRPSPPTPQSQRWLRLGREALDVEASWAASELLQKAVQADPSQLEPRLLLAEAWVQQDRLELARTALLEAGESLDARWLPPASARTAFAAARASSLYQHAKAAAAYAQLAAGADAPAKPSLLTALARAQIRNGEPASAAASLRQATADDPQYAPAWLRLGNALLLRNLRAEAAAAFQKAEEIFRIQGNAEALVELACLRAPLQTIPEARSALHAAFAQVSNPARPASQVRALFALSRLEQSAGEGDASIDAAQQARATAATAGLDALAVQGLIELANGWSTQYRMADMQRLLREALAQAESIRAYTLAARARFELARALSRIGGSEPEIARLLEHAANFYTQSGMPGERIKVLNWRVLLDIRHARYAPARRDAQEIRAHAAAASTNLSVLDADELLAEIDDRTANFPSAIATLTRAAQSHESASRLQRAAYNFINAAHAAVRFAGLADAARLLDSAAAVLTRLDQPRSSAWILHKLVQADLALAENRYPQALDMARQVIGLSAGKSAGRIDLARGILARATAATGRRAEGLALAESALAGTIERGQLFIVSQLYLRHLQTLLHAGRAPQALQLLPARIAWFDERTHLAEAAEARIFLAALTSQSPDLRPLEQLWGRESLTRFRNRPDLAVLLQGARPL